MSMPTNDPMRKCLQCGEEFAPEHASALLCSDVCRIARHNDTSLAHNRKVRARMTRVRAAMRAAIKRVCPECSVEFTPGTARQRICSDECRVRRETAKVQRWADRVATLYSDVTERAARVRRFTEENR
jgi:hypothetical protein